jgi:hypothetical protein
LRRRSTFVREVAEKGEGSDTLRDRVHACTRGRCHRHLGRRTMSAILYAATLASALGCGLVAGVFFAFSTFVMAALRRLKPEEGIAAIPNMPR